MKGLVVFLLLGALAVPLAAQTPAADPAIAAVKAALAAGRYEEALAAVQAMPASKDTLRLRLDAHVGLKQFDKALATYDEIGDVEHKTSPDLLAKIASAVLTDVSTQPDPIVALAACKALMARHSPSGGPSGGASGGAAPCAKRLTEQAKSTTQPMSMRLAALATLAAGGQAGASAEFLQLAAQAKGREQRTVVSAARDLPPADAVAAVKPALSNPQEDIQYSAAIALGEVPSPESRKALSEYLAGNGSRVGKSAARLSLAILGDEESLKQFLPALPEMQGGDLLALGEALAAKGDGRGDEALERATRDDRELVRLGAAARLAATKPAIATPIFKGALQDVNPIMRAAALKEFRTTPLMTIGWARGYLLDKDPTVRVRACEALFTTLGASGAAPAGAAARLR
jgi:hypothetical protein